MAWPRWTGPSSWAASRGPYALQAAIAACHARAFRPATPTGRGSPTLYGVLAEVLPVAGGRAQPGRRGGHGQGPQAGLDHLDALAAEPALRGYHLLPSVRGDLLMKLGRPAEAAQEFARAASLTGNVAERELSAARAREAGEQARAQGSPGR